MYEINILENDEFDALPYKHAKSSLGMADAATGRAYVRRTGIESLDADTIRHEFDELLQRVSPHEEDGIRYKSGKGLGSIFAPIVGGLAYLVNPALGVAVGAALKAGTSAHSSSVKPEKYGENTFGSVLTNAAVGGLGAYGAGNIASGALGGFKAAGEAGKGFFGQLGGALKGATGLGGSGAAGGENAITSGIERASADSAARASQFAGAQGGLGGAISRGIEGASQASALRGVTPSAFGAGTTAAIAGAGKKTLSESLAGFGKSATQGIGKSLATNALVSSLAPPQSTAVTGAGNYGGGQDYGANQGQQSIMSLFGNRPTTGQKDFQLPFSQEDFDQGVARINTQSSRQTGNVFDQFRAAQPGASIEGSSAFANQLGAVEEGNRQNIGAFTQQTNDANQQAYSQFRYDGVKNANGLSDAKMQEYMNLAKQPDDVIKGQFPGMTPQAFRDIFSGIT